MSYLAPAGTTLQLGDIARGFYRGLHLDRSGNELTATLSRLSQLPHSWDVASARAGMTIVLSAMRAVASDPLRDEVLIPAYTCYSVPAAVVRAGLKPRLCDVDPATLGMDVDLLRQADFRRVLAVVSANLYGLPNDLPEIEHVSQEQGVFMLDDAAQALGARIGERAAGAFGDAGLFSFDRGKIICTIQGGAIVAKDSALSTRLGAVLDTLETSSIGETLGNCAKLPVYALLLRPTLYGIVQNLPFLGLGKTVFETKYPITRLSKPQIGVAAELAGRLDSLNDQRRANARRLAEALRELRNILLPTVRADALRAYARFPLRIVDPQMRRDVVQLLNTHGIGASTSYPLCLADVPEVRAIIPPSDADMPGARELAAQIVTLPTHGYCQPDLGRRVRSLLREYGA